MTTSFAEAVMIPTVRAQLERLATWQIEGRLTGHALCCLARNLRTLAPALAERNDEAVIRAFDELVESVAVRDTFADNSASWCELISEATGSDRDDQALTAAQARVDLTLDALMAGV